VVMEYANDSDLLSYLNRNINKLTWKMKLQLLGDIANCLLTMIYEYEMVHCNLHGSNIVLHKTDPTKVLSKPFLCGFSLSHTIGSESDSNIQGVLPFIAPEVFSTHKFTPESDIYSFGIIMYLVATGELPLRDRLFDKNLACDIMGGLRPAMPHSAPEEYKKLAENCCNADPGKRPKIRDEVDLLIGKVEKDEADDVWNTIYHNVIKPLSLWKGI
jgi:serine/threonine protein kinase